jgi:hypothetical protein
MSRSFFLLILAVLVINQGLALGITPARTTLDFEPNLTKQILFEIINSQNDNITVLISVQGNLSKYIKLPISNISLSKQSRRLTYNLTLPEQLGPGLHTAEIIATQSKEQNKTLTATISVVTGLHIYVPVPEKTANAKLYVYTSDPQNVKFATLVVNTGGPTLTSVKANIEIYNQLNKKMANFTTESVQIPSGQIKELQYIWQANMPLSQYIAKVIIIYDNKTLNLQETFTAGSGEDNDIDEYTKSNGDCNDNDSTIHPNATEIPYNEIDEDCSGQDLIDIDNDGYNFTTDCNDTNPFLYLNITAYQDNDNDTWTIKNATTFCTNETLPLGYVKTQKAEDTNDNDSAIYPGIIKITSAPTYKPSKNFRSSSTETKKTHTIPDNTTTLRTIATDSQKLQTNTTYFENINISQIKNTTTNYNSLQKNINFVINNSPLGPIFAFKTTRQNLINLIIIPQYFNFII